MKRKILTAIAVVTMACEAIGQVAQHRAIEYGINYNPTITFSQKQERPPAYNSAIGVFAKYALYKRVGIGAGIEYQSQNVNTTTWVNCDPLEQYFFCQIPGKDEFDVIRLPIWLSLNLNYNPDSKIKVELIGGYAFGKLQNANEKEEAYGLLDLTDKIHFAFTGIEFKKKVCEKFNMTFGTHIEFTNIYDMRYGEIQNLKFVLRISR